MCVVNTKIWLFMCPPESCGHGAMSGDVSLDRHTGLFYTGLSPYARGENQTQMMRACILI